MQKNIWRIVSFSAALVTASFFHLGAESAEPGTFENSAPAGLERVLAVDAKLSPSKNELVVYYVRNDGNYGPWALWMWALPGGDGAAMWEYTRSWKVMDGVGYMRFPMDGSGTGGIRPVSAEGGVGLIVRQESGWIKDGEADREWSISTSNKVVIFERDPRTYAAEPYLPQITGAELVSEDTIKLTLSGKYGLATDGSDSGFVIRTRDGRTLGIKEVVNSDSANASDNYTAHVTVRLSDNASVADAIYVTNPAFRGEAQVSGRNLAMALASKAVPGDDINLGAEYKGGSVTFNLWAPTSSSAAVNLYRKSGAVSADYTVPMSYDGSTGVWSAVFDSVDPEGFFYDYTLTNSKGTVTVLDPYAKSMDVYRGKGGPGRGAIIDLSSKKAFDGEYEPYYPLKQREDAVIYEVSVRDFTISPDAGVSAVPGTYNAFIEKIPYLKSLGITHVQLLPVLNFYFNDETDKSYDNRGVVNGSNYNWGYDPHNYFTPEGWYASDPQDPYVRVRELRNLINELHKAGIGVLLDVVYNHVADSALLDNIVPGYYFRTKADGSLTNASGCGNDTASERAMMKRLIMDSTRFWVEQYHVDGFRFDIMGLMEASSVQDSYNRCARINPHVLFVGEAWKMYNGAPGTAGMDQNYMLRTNDVAAFNDEFRDLVKAGGFNETGLGFITGKAINTERLFRNMCGSPTVNYKADDPGDNLQYLVCHDGLTLHDLIVNNCHLTDENDADEITARIKLGNVLGLTAQGIAFLHAGQERGRTKPNVHGSKNESINNFVRNSYDSSDNINQIIWTLDDRYQNVADYTAGLVRLRRETSAFRLGTAKKVSSCMRQIVTGKGDQSVIAFTVKADGTTYIVAVNAGVNPVSINTSLNLKGAKILVDAESAGVQAIENPVGVKVSGKVMELDGLTAAVVRVK